ncbi:MAG: hypothetical protein EXR00_09395 [Alphaproteobacteria bacterium]|nr:hypothetical protein [Alphaproteobacteria bacterium]
MNLGLPFAVTAILLASWAPANAQSAAPPTCLNVSNIQRSETPDDRTIIFHMRDGKVWRNRLKTVCPMLRTSPFTQVLRSGDLMCANQQTIQVTQTGSTCMLGDFTPVISER